MKKYNYGYQFQSELKKIFLFSFLLISSSSLYSQIVPVSKINNDVKVESDRINNTVNIEFSTDKEVYNLMILITDSSGQTVFLDNRYRFKGGYKNIVDFTDYSKGLYSVKIIADEENIIKEIDTN